MRPFLNLTHSRLLASKDTVRISAEKGGLWKLKEWCTSFRCRISSSSRDYRKHSRLWNNRAGNKNESFGFSKHEKQAHFFFSTVYHLFMAHSSPLPQKWKFKELTWKNSSFCVCVWLSTNLTDDDGTSFWHDASQTVEFMDESKVVLVQNVVMFQ